MEFLSSFLMPALLALPVMKLLAFPVRLGWKLLVHGGCGLVCLWLLNLVSGITGVLLPVNGITVLIAGFGGLPGMVFLALLEFAA